LSKIRLEELSEFQSEKPWISIATHLKPGNNIQALKTYDQTNHRKEMKGERVETHCCVRLNLNLVVVLI
jgi:hypothetical protein